MASIMLQKKSLLAGVAVLCIAGTVETVAYSASPQASASAALTSDARTLAQRIDQAISKRLNTQGVKPSPLADDAEFLRRVYLDITGVIPPADKAAAFLESKDPDKRRQAHR